MASARCRAVDKTARSNGSQQIVPVVCSRRARCLQPYGDALLLFGDNRSPERRLSIPLQYRREHSSDLAHSRPHRSEILPQESTLCLVYVPRLGSTLLRANITEGTFAGFHHGALQSPRFPWKYRTLSDYRTSSGAADSGLHGKVAVRPQIQSQQRTGSSSRSSSPWDGSYGSV